jgi:hypothetical protein
MFVGGYRSVPPTSGKGRHKSNGDTNDQLDDPAVGPPTHHASPNLVGKGGNRAFQYPFLRNPVKSEDNEEGGEADKFQPKGEVADIFSQSRSKRSGQQLKKGFEVGLVRVCVPRTC